jgi:RND family efflux transporter MFP subunit
MKKYGKRLLLAAIVLVAVVAVVLKIAASRDGAEQKRPALPRVAVEAARRENVVRALRFNGDVLPAQQAAVFAKVTGTLERSYADIGDRVRAGQVLARIDSTELAQTARQAAATWMNANANYTRSKGLADQNLVSKQDLDNADAAVKIAHAAHENARTRLGYAAVTAPFAGVVTKRFLDPGAVVTAANATLFTLMDLDVVKVVVNVLEKDVPLVRKGMAASVKVDAFPGRTFTGKVTRLSEAIDLGTRTMAVQIDVPNRDHALKGGMFATVDAVVEVHPDAITVPSAALLKDGTGAYVYIAEGAVAKRVAVRPGIERDLRTEILSGLAEGQRVVTSGQSMLRDGAPIQQPK